MEEERRFSHHHCFEDQPFYTLYARSVYMMFWYGMNMVEIFKIHTPLHAVQYDGSSLASCFLFEFPFDVCNPLESDGLLYLPLDRYWLMNRGMYQWHVSKHHISPQTEYSWMKMKRLLQEKMLHQPRLPIKYKLHIHIHMWTRLHMRHQHSEITTAVGRIMSQPMWFPHSPVSIVSHQQRWRYVSYKTFKWITVAAVDDSQGEIPYSPQPGLVVTNYTVWRLEHHPMM